MSPFDPLVDHTVVVAGIGSEYRHDDGVGMRIAEQVAKRVGGAVDVSPVVDPLDLLGRWDDADLAIVVDAVHSGTGSGCIRVIDLSPPNRFSTGAAIEGAGLASESGHDSDGPRAEGSPMTSSHGIGLAGVLRLARAVGRAPRRVVLVGIEGDDFTPGPGLSPSVERAVPEAVRRVIRLIEEARRCA